MRATLEIIPIYSYLRIINTSANNGAVKLILNCCLKTSINRTKLDRNHT
jgi:hypothetical protein